MALLKAKLIQHIQHFWSAKPVKRLGLVPVLRYILPLRFRDAAPPGAKKNLIPARKTILKPRLILSGIIFRCQFTAFG